MADSASITILLNASGNLGSAVDAATGKVLRLGKATQAARGDAQVAAQGLAAFGEQGAKAFGSAGSALAKFAGPLGALGGISAVAGLAMSKALDLAREKFVALIEEPVRLAEAMRDAAKAADELAKARAAAISSNVSKLGGVAEPLVAQGSLAFARQLSTDTGIPLEEVSKAVQAGGQAGISETDLRRIVEAAKLVRQSGRMSFDDAVAAGIGNRATADFAPAEVAADMVNRDAFRAHQSTATDERRRQLLAHQSAQDAARAEHDRRRAEEYDAAQLAWNLGGQQGDRPTMGPEFQPTPFRSTVRFKPSVTAADFASMQANLAASPIVAAVEAKRASEAKQADLALEDVATEGAAVVDQETREARIDRMYPGLRKFMEEDKKLQRDAEVSRVKSGAWSFSPWSDAEDEEVAIQRERSRRFDAFFRSGGFKANEDAESPEAFLARGDAERARLEQAGKAAGVPFGSGLSTVESLLERIAQGVESKSPAPLQEAQ